MKITLRPYAHDKNRWHVDIRLMNPCSPARELRKRMVAPKRLSEQQARAWGERQVPKDPQVAVAAAAGKARATGASAAAASSAGRMGTAGTAAAAGRPPAPGLDGMVR